MIVAAGPFSSNGDLLYRPLQDLLDIVKRDRPHVLMLMGPFLDAKSGELQNGDISYSNSGEQTYLDYADLSKILMDMIRQELGRQNTQVVLMPSARDINHIYPLPQPPYPGRDFIKVCNPQTFRINDITFGGINADVIKEIIMSDVSKELQGPKIEVAWKSLLEQRTYFPVYPSNPSTPIEWSQWRQMMFEHTPDVLIIPSDLMLFAKVSLFFVLIMFRKSKGVSVSTQACWSKARIPDPTHQSLLVHS